MIELVQFPWSPYCLVQKRILEFSGFPYKLTNIPNSDRALVWKMTRQRYYGVPIIRDGRRVIFETSHDSQIIAKYLDGKFGLGLFPRELDGLQTIVWRAIESEIEDVTFRLNDIYWRELLPADEQLAFLRYKERKFGPGCLDQWRANQASLLAELIRRLIPYERMLACHPFLLADQPRFTDFDLHGMLANFLYSGHYRLPTEHTRLRRWYRQLEKLKFPKA